MKNEPNWADYKHHVIASNPDLKEDFEEAELTSRIVGTVLPNNPESKSHMSLDNTLDRGIANVEIEGFRVDAEMREWCRKLLTNEITYSDYISLLREKAKRSEIMKKSGGVMSQ